MTISLLNQITDQFFYMSLMIFIQALKIQTHVMVSHKKGGVRVGDNWGARGCYKDKKINEEKFFDLLFYFQDGDRK